MGGLDIRVERIDLFGVYILWTSPRVNKKNLLFFWMYESRISWQSRQHHDNTGLVIYYVDRMLKANFLSLMICLHFTILLLQCLTKLYKNLSYFISYLQNKKENRAKNVNSLLMIFHFFIQFFVKEKFRLTTYYMPAFTKSFPCNIIYPKK